MAVGLAAGLLGACAQAARPTLHQLFGTVIPGRVSPNNLWESVPHPKGWVMVIHGGSWIFVGPKATRTKLGPTYFNPRGWGVYSIDYRPGKRSFWDAVAAYDHLRAKVGYRIPVCVLGLSAGGQLALLVAAVRPSVSCVISEAGPTDLSRIASQPAFTAPGKPPSTVVPQAFARATKRWVFQNLWRWSPVRLAHLMHMPVLLGGSSWDQIIPEAAQMREFKAARPATKTLLLAGGPDKDTSSPLWFVHAGITRSALTRWDAALDRLLHAVQ
jgi:acetyl esterase/lipase